MSSSTPNTSPNPSSSGEELAAADLAARDVYRLMTDLVAPRPIAWVSTVNGDGQRNLAPFSYYQAVCSRPATVVLGLSWRGDGKPKDTLANILETRQLTISHVSRPLAEAMNATSLDAPPELDEAEYVGVPMAPAKRVRPPRVAGALAALECELRHAVPLGKTRSGSPSSTLVVAEVLHFHVAEGLLERNEKGHLRPIDPARLAAVGRLGGIAYTDTSGAFELARPARPIQNS